MAADASPLTTLVEETDLPGWLPSLGQWLGELLIGVGVLLLYVTSQRRLLPRAILARLHSELADALQSAETAARPTGERGGEALASQSDSHGASSDATTANVSQETPK